MIRINTLVLALTISNCLTLLFQVLTWKQ